MTKWHGTLVTLPIENHQLQRHAQWIYRLASRMSQSQENRQKFKNSFFAQIVLKSAEAHKKSIFSKNLKNTS